MFKSGNHQKSDAEIFFERSIKLLTFIDQEENCDKQACRPLLIFAAPTSNVSLNGATIVEYILKRATICHEALTRGPTVVATELPHDTVIILHTWNAQGVRLLKGSKVRSQAHSLPRHGSCEIFASRKGSTQDNPVPPSC